MKTLGIDVSHHNGSINWQKVARADVKFAYLKVSEGEHFRDRLFEEHIRGAQDNGILVGGYHFFKPKVNGQKQADNFLDAVEKFKLDLPSVLDWEVSDGADSRIQQENAILFLKNFDRAMIYTGPYFFRDKAKGGEEFKKYPLWIAHYDTAKPLIPPPWDKCTIHQFTENGTIMGVNGVCDINWFMGSENDLRNFAKAPEAPVKPPVERIELPPANTEPEKESLLKRIINAIKRLFKRG